MFYFYTFLVVFIVLFIAITNLLSNKKTEELIKQQKEKNEFELKQLQEKQKVINATRNKQEQNKTIIKKEDNTSNDYYIYF